MNNPTTITTKDIPELLEFIDEVKNRWAWQPEEDAMFDAIRALILEHDRLEKAWENLLGVGLTALLWKEGK